MRENSEDKMSLRIWRDKFLAVAVVWLGTAIALYWAPSYGSQLVLLFSAFLIGEFVFAFLKTANGNFKNPFGNGFLSAGHSYVLFYSAVILSSLGGGYLSALILQLLTPNFGSLEYDAIIGLVIALITFVDLEVRYMRIR